MATGDSTAVVFGQAWLAYQAHDVANDFPDIDSGDEYGTATDYTYAGYTQEGINFGVSVTRGAIDVDQLLESLFTPITGREMTFSTNLAQWTATNLQLAFGQGTISTVAAGAGTHGYTELSIGDVEPDTYYSWLIDIEQQDTGEPIRILGYKMVPVGSVESTFGDLESNAQVPIELQVLPDDSTTPTRYLDIREYVAPTS